MVRPHAEPGAHLLLALDTATMRSGVALYDGDLVAETLWPAGRHGSQTLLPEVERMLRLAGQSIKQITAVAVALGPGSFSALRVGLSTAKGLALGLACPLIGIPTLDVVAYPHRHTGGTVWAVLDAGRARVVAAPYASTAEGWRMTQSPVHGAVAQLAEQIAGPALVCGEIGAGFTLLADRPDVTVAPPSLRARRAGSLAELAWFRLQAGDVDDPLTLEPLYLHNQAAASS